MRAAYDSRSGRMRLEAENRSGIALPGERVQQAETTGIAGITGVEQPFFIAARASFEGLCRHFNGKIESPRLWSGGKALAWWDFAADICVDPGHRQVRARPARGNGKSACPRGNRPQLDRRHP